MLHCRINGRGRETGPSGVGKDRKMERELEPGMKVAFRENADTVAQGEITRVWDKPRNNPYVSIKTGDKRMFVRFSSEVTPR